MKTNEMLDQAVAQAKEKNVESFILIVTAKDGQGLWTNLKGGEVVSGCLLHSLIEISMQTTKKEAHTELLEKLRGIIDSVERQSLNQQIDLHN